MRTSRLRATTSLAYVERVNQAIDHVVTHLDEPLRLVAVAKAAALSPFHFHRVFQAMMGLTLAEFVKQLRLDKALSLLALPQRPSLTTIAHSSGFSSSSDFSRCFKQRFGVAASAFDLEAWRAKHWSSLAPAPLQRLPKGLNPDQFKARVHALPARTVAYVRVRNPYRPDAVGEATQRLVAWAERHQVADGQWLGYQWENPELVPLEHCRYHAAVEVEPFTPRGEVGCFRFPPMQVAEVEVRGGIELELRALQWLYGMWLPRSGYVPDDQPCFEAWLGRPFAHGTSHFELKVQLPVRRR